jgi:ferrous iron transport protein B
VAFLFGFFRRDYGAAGLYDLQHNGGLTGNQLLVATVTLTIFLPCVAQFLIMRKERGWGPTLAMSGVILATAFGVGWLLKTALDLTGMVL